MSLSKRHALRPTAARAFVVSSASLCVLCCMSTVPANADVTPTVNPESNLTSPAGNLPTSIQYPDASFQNDSAVLPDGRFITPAGRTEQVEQEPQSVVMSRDGQRVYIGSGAYEDMHSATDIAAGDAATGSGERYFTVVNTTTMAKVNVEDDATTQGIAESADGSTVYVDEGQTDTLGVFHRSADGSNGGIGSFSKIADYSLEASGGKPDDYPWGLALSPDGTKAYVTGYGGDVLITVSTSSGAVLSRVKTGSYPYGVAISPDGTTAYVTNWGIYNSDAELGYSSPIDPPPVSYGGDYNTTNSDSVWSYTLPANGSAPTVATATRIGQDIDGADVIGASSPSGIALSPDGSTLAVSSSNDDDVELLNTTTTQPSTAVPSTSAPDVPQFPTSTVDMRALVGNVAIPAPSGSQPNAVAWSASGKELFVAEGQRDAVAIIDPSKVVPDSTLTSTEGDATGGAVGSAAGPNRGAITGRIPTAWYPGALAVSPAGGDLWVGDVRGFGTGPTHSLDDPDIKDDQTGAVQDIPLQSACATLPSLTATSDRDNGLVVPATTAGSNGDGSVIPTTYGSGPSQQIKHVFVIIKENKTFDEELGDIGARAETDPALTEDGANITPNLHSAVSQYATSDNYYATIETSTQGHNYIDGGQVNEFVDKVTPTSYIGKFPYGSYDTLPENLPEGGFIWNDAAAGGVHSTVYGEGEYEVGVGPAAVGKSAATPPTQLATGVQQDGFITFDAAYPSQVDFTNLAPGEQGATDAAGYYYNDEGRVSEFDSSVGQSVVSQLNVMILFDDHTAGDLPGADSPEDNIAENDHALGEVLDEITHSSYWPSSAVFVTEDDTQGGEDHVDQHRNLLTVVSPYAKKGYVSHVHTSFASLNKTVDLILGLPPTSLQEMTSTSLADMFTPTPTVTNTYATVPETVYQYMNPSSPVNSPNPLLAQASADSIAAPRQIDQGGPLFDAALRLDREGEAENHDPNVVTYPGTIHNDLPSGDPTPVPPLATASLTRADSSASAAAQSSDPAAGCLVSAVTAPPVLPESSQPGLFVGAFALAAGGGWWARKRLGRRGRRSARD